MVRQRLGEGKLMILSTCVGNQPWSCSLLYAADEKLNIYWVCKTESRHSQELVKNPKCSIAVPIKFDPDGKKVGLQIEGEAKLIEDMGEMQRAVKVYAKRYGIGEEWQKQMIQGKDEHKMYKFVPIMIGVFDHENFPNEGRMEWRP